MRTRFLPLWCGSAAVVIVSTAATQSLSVSFRSHTQMEAYASFIFASDRDRIPAGVDLRGGRRLYASVSGASAETRILFNQTQTSVLARIEERAQANFGSTASTGLHDTLLTLDASRDFTGRVRVTWSASSGDLTGHVDLGNDGSYEFTGYGGQNLTRYYNVSFGPGRYLLRTHTGSRTSNSETLQGMLEVRFLPDANHYGPASYSTFGVGCPGSNGTPSLAAGGGQRPWVSESFQVVITNLPTSVIATPFGLLGFSTTSWNGLPLPLGLGMVGMDGCTLYTDIAEAVPLVNTSGTATWTMTLPPITGLVGLNFYQQCFVLDPGTNPLGAIVSNTGQGIIGGR